MNTVILLFVITLVTLQQVTKKVSSAKGAKGAFSFSGASALTAVCVFLVTAGGKLEFCREITVYSVLFALSYSVACAFSFLAISTGPLSLTALITSYSLVIPTVYGLLFLDEPISVILIVGIVLLMISLLLINYEKKESGGERKITLKWAIFVFLAFAGNGMCSTVQKVQQMDFGGKYKSEFMIIALLISAALLLLTSLFYEKKQLPTNLRRGLVWYLICGLANGITNYLVMVLSTRMPASVMFPLISAGGIVATLAVSLLIYREKLSGKQIAGVILGILSIIAFNL